MIVGNSQQIRREEDIISVNSKSHFTNNCNFLTIRFLRALAVELYKSKV